MTAEVMVDFEDGAQGVMSMKSRSYEAICRKHAKLGPAVFRDLKRRASKGWRKMARENPEAAPVKRPTRGYCD